MNKLCKVLILLVFFGLGIQCASAADTISFKPQTVQMNMDSFQNVQIVMDDVPSGLAGFNITVSVDPKIAEITSVSFPSWSTVNISSTLPSSSVNIMSIDGRDFVKKNHNQKNVSFGNITLIGKKAGTADLTISVSSYYTTDGPNAKTVYPDAVAGTINILDTEKPVISSVELNNSTPNTDDSIIVTVDTTDNVGVNEVKANDVLLTNDSGVWSGSITAVEGVHFVNVSAKDAAENIA
ncbi:MAG TPA: hypothetical protein VN414_10450, partial [Methanosarcina sp.]|nr:hypothetical protein [Methanosarcina sp.]